MTASIRPRRSSAPYTMAVLGGLVLIIIVLIGLYILTRGDAPRPKVQVVQNITVLQPPPPPPPPPQQKIEPKDVLKPVEVAKPQEDVQEVDDQPTPDPTPSQAAGLNRPADIGSDSFRLVAGKGGGLFGRGSGGGGSWAAFVQTHVRRALQSDPRTRSAAGYLEMLFSIDEDGRFQRAELQSSTGNAELDAAIRDVLSKLAPLSRGRPPGVDALTVTAINLRAAGG